MSLYKLCIKWLPLRKLIDSNDKLVAGFTTAVFVYIIIDFPE